MGGKDRPVPEAFGAGEFAVARLATLPATAATTTATTSTTAPSFDDAEALTAYILETVADPVLREAITVSSTSLARTIEKLEIGETLSLKRLRKTALSVTRYLLRTTGRPTPFGLHAGVARVDIGESAKVRIGEDHVKRVRPDAAWLSTIHAELRGRPEIRETLLLTTNDLCTVRGDRIVLPYVRESDDRQISVGYSPVVRAAVEAARSPIPYRDLRDLLLDGFPDADESDADRLLGGLIEREILLTDLEARLDREPPRVTALRDVYADLDAYARQPVGEGLPQLTDAVGRLEAMHTTDKPPIHVDLRMDADIRLPRAVFAEVARVADVLWRLGPPGTNSPTLDRYQNAFLERYGTDQVVPITELLDPHLGLGPPGGFRNPPADRPAAPKPENFYPESRDEILATALDAVDGDELVLDDALVERLAGPADGVEDARPDSLDLCVQLFADSAEEVTNGAYTLAVGPGAGSLTAGAMCGRFADLLELEPAMADLFARTQDAGTQDRLLAQLFFQPARPRHRNVVQVPAILPYRIPVGCFDRHGTDEVLDIGEIAVGTTGERLYLTIPRLGREISVLSPHMLNQVSDAPNPARFLTVVSLGGVRPFAPWNWSRLAVLPRLPRVRSGRTIVSPAMWRPSSEMSDPSLSWPEWQRALGSWRERLAVPDVVRVSVYDNHVELDLDDPMHQRVLHDHLRRRTPSPIWESPTTYGGLGLTGGRFNELVVPLVSATARPAVPDIPAWHARPARVAHRPGGEWLYAKVYLLGDLQDSFLARHVSRLVDAMPDSVDRWFFLRYRDPESHLRLRFHAPAADLNAHALPALHAWADALAEIGGIERVELDTYEPEVSRYGGPDALEAAERFFAADSSTVLRLLAMRAGGRLDIPIEVLAAMNHASTLSALSPSGEWDWREWVLDAYPIRLSNDVPAADRRAALDRIDVGLSWDALRALPGGPEVLALWETRAEAAAAYGRRLRLGAPDAHLPGVNSILHMHANRLIGPDREAEKRSYGLLRAAVRRFLDERRHHHERPT